MWKRWQNDKARCVRYQHWADAGLSKCHENCVAAWLASDEADYTCVASIYVDDGMTLYPGFATGG